MNQKQENKKFYLDKLNSNQCFCGKHKGPGRSFCYHCYHSLPPEMQRKLYRNLNIHDGYGEAYDKAVEWLT